MQADAFAKVVAGILTERLVRKLRDDEMNWCAVLPQMEALVNDPSLNDYDPLGACSYVREGQTVCENLTNAQCNALGGTWKTGQRCVHPDVRAT